MGRGLSELQKTMLTMQPGQSGFILVRDVITKYYGWVQHPPYWHFSKTEIGQQKYMSGYIAIRKAMARLRERGLIRSPDWSMKANNFSKYELTPEGRELSAKLYANAVKPLDLDQIAAPNAKNPSMCSLYDGIYECSSCGVKFEPFRAESFPMCCPFCKKRTLRKYRP